ncbi:TPA: hypothetical protein PC496_000782 [Clostridioides difficile]|nr:hypothetical protein [Clostridioides difficile]
MPSKKIKIQIDDDIKEYEVEENKSLVIEVQNKDDNIVVYTNEKDYFTAFDQSKIDIFDVDYIPENHSSSILDVIYNNNSELEEFNIPQEIETVDEKKDKTDEKDISQSDVGKNISYKKEDDEQESNSDIIDDMLNKYKNKRKRQAEE